MAQPLNDVWGMAMSRKYAIALHASVVLPQRDAWIHAAWGDVPVSHFQSDEDLNNCSFLDLKVNKWEIGSEERAEESEPFIRVEILRAHALVEHLGETVYRPPADAAQEIILVLELDDGGNELDEGLLKRLVSILAQGNRLYCWKDGFRLAGMEFAQAVPTLKDVQLGLQQKGWDVSKVVMVVGE
ncbi:TPA: hypothetical protein UOA91_003115 [Stenotrophomonas maltophilia]|nr:hypothetical protein [Stenotrophomonas maltophilia]HEL3778442.1 hypothetical protein [Stenotrophomonas maltophilia]HEL5006871.1 hypothetical protein [Stenotrophomonas maltophilia]